MTTWIFGAPVPEDVLARLDVPKRKKRGHAAPPGSGPKGETCGTCAHAVMRGDCAGRYYKCALMRERWTGGAATDIRLKDEACSMWTKD